jgi:hypothetical protein
VNEPVKRICDWPDCLEWAITTVTAERDHGLPALMGYACRTHMQVLIREATVQGIPIEDSR